MTPEAAALYNVANPGTDHRIADLAARAGLTWEQAKAGAAWWMANADDVAVEPESHQRRITPQERQAPLVIGGEARHLIRFAD